MQNKFEIFSKLRAAALFILVLLLMNVDVDQVTRLWCELVRDQLRPFFWDLRVLKFINFTLENNIFIVRRCANVNVECFGLLDTLQH